MPEQRYCNKCRKTMADTNFYTYKDGTKAELCKSCMTMHINNFEPDTFLWLLEKFDVPYIEAEWNVLRDRAYQKDPYKMNGMSVFGKYLSKMKLKQWKNFTWADTEKLKLKAEEEAKLYGRPADQAKKELENMKTAYENGEITEAQYQTYAETHAPEPSFEKMIPPSASNSSFPYPVNDNPFEQIEIPDVGNDLTEEDKIYLALKWGRLYSAADWVYLESKYNDFINSFDIQGAARIDTLIQICKLSLKMNQAIDSGDMDSYAKLVRAYDALMKSAKFTEAQRKEEKSGEFDAVGQIVYFAEKENGAIPRHKIETPIDIVDEAIQNLKRYVNELITSDTSLSQQIENYLKRKEIAEKHKEDLRKAKEYGNNFVELEDQDFVEFNDYISLQKEENAEEENE